MNAASWLLGLITLVHAVNRCWADQVRLPPTIIEGPSTKHYLFVTSESGQFPCKAKGTPDPTYQWFHNGKQLSNSEFIEINQGTLIFREFTSYHEGYYQCVASNSHGKAVSIVVFLEQAVLANIPSNDIKPYEAKQGESLKVICEGAKSVPKSQTTYSWRVAKDILDEGNLLLLDRRRFIDDFGNLYFANVLPEDQRDDYIYKCKIHNQKLDSTKGGSYSTLKISSVANPPIVQPKIMFSTGPDQIVLEGQSLIMKCFFSGFPDPNLNWVKKNGNLPVDRLFYSSNKQQLEIKEVRFSDEGVYVCRGDNTAGLGDSVEISVTVQSEPRWHDGKGPINRNATQGETISFLCLVDAVPQASIQWFINGEALSLTSPGNGRMISDDGTNLTITNVQKPQDIMNVQCNASNVHDYLFADAYLNVLLPTKVSVGPPTQTIDMNTTTIMIGCNASADISTPISVLWYHNNKEVVYRPGVIERLNYSLVINCQGMTEEQRILLEGQYLAVASNGYSYARASSVIIAERMPTSAPVVVGASGFQMWMIALIVAGVVFILILILCCCVCCQRNRGEAYPVDEKERAQGNDPAKELDDGGFHDYVRPEEAPVKGSRASLNSSIKMDSDDEGSLNEYGEMDPTKFNEDGSFIGQYANDNKKHREIPVPPPPYTAVRAPYMPVSRHMDTDV